MTIDATALLALLFIAPMVAVTFVLLGAGAWVWCRAMMAYANALAQLSQARALERDIDRPHDEQTIEPRRDPIGPPRVDLDALDDFAEAAIRRGRRDPDAVRTTDDNAGYDEAEHRMVGGTTLFRGEP